MSISVNPPRIELALAMWNGARFDLPLVAYRAAKGLAVHRITNVDGTQEKEWTITHIQSGRRVVGNFRTRADACLAARRMARLADWSQPFSDDMATWGPEGLEKKVRAIRNRINGVPKNVV